jgi:hypothetical protein
MFARMSPWIHRESADLERPPDGLPAIFSLEAANRLQYNPSLGEAKEVLGKSFACHATGETYTQ